MKKVLLTMLLIFFINIFVQCNSSDTSTNNAPKLTPYSVVIDAAHGGRDPGAISIIDSTSEKDIVLQISKLVKTELENEGIKSLLTREHDRFLSLKDRVNLAENSNANLNITIHTNNSKDLTKNGYTTFYQDNNTSSKLLDSYIHDELNQLNLFQDNGSQIGTFYMITESSIPSVMIDLGYINNPDDFKEITDKKNQKEIAAALARAIKRYHK